MERRAGAVERFVCGSGVSASAGLYSALHLRVIGLGEMVGVESGRRRLSLGAWPGCANGAKRSAALVGLSLSGCFWAKAVDCCCR